MSSEARLTEICSARWNTGSLISTSSSSKSVRSLTCQKAASSEMESVVGRCFIFFSTADIVPVRDRSWGEP